MVTLDQSIHALMGLLGFFAGTVIHDLRGRIVRLEDSELSCKAALAEIRGAARQHGWPLSDD